MHFVSFIYTNFGQLLPWQRYHSAVFLEMESHERFQMIFHYAYTVSTNALIYFIIIVIHAEPDILLFQNAFG